MKFILEETRAGQEELEYLEKAICCLLNDRKRASGVKLVTIDGAINYLFEESQSIARTLLNYYKDVDGVRRDEIKFLAGSAGDKQSNDATLWTNYYSTIKQIKDFYKQHEHLNIALEPRTVDNLVKHACSRINVDLIFSPDENYGKCLDLQNSYRIFCNLQGLRTFRAKNHKQREIVRLAKKGHKDPKVLEHMISPFTEVDYSTYVNTFDQFHLVPRYLKYRCHDWFNYLKQLMDYLQDFFRRQNPLACIEDLMDQFEDSFEQAWNRGTIHYWKEPTETMSLYLKPVDRLLSSEGVYKSFQQGKRFKAAAQAFASKSMKELEQHSAASREHDKELAKMEFIISSFKSFLAHTVEKTIENVHKRESRTGRELQDAAATSGSSGTGLALAILEAVENDAQNYEQDGIEEEDEEKPVYNPLNLPLGWDGKPIPFWLYKLHGLGQEFKCEICGNYSYWGRKAFENHFQEWRHAFGMKCLGIPNTPHFKEIVNIQDAFALYEKLKTQSDKNTFKVAQEVECEDSQGNVMNARAYEDLRRQGLL